MQFNERRGVFFCFFLISIIYNYFQNFTHFLAVNYQGAIYCYYTGWYVPYFVQNIKYRFSQDRAPIMNGDSMSYSAVLTFYEYSCTEEKKLWFITK